MCIHDRPTLRAAQDELAKNPTVGIVTIIGERTGDAFSVAVNVKSEESIMQAIADLKDWHPGDTYQVALANTNRKRKALGLPIVYPAPPTNRKFVKGFESNGITFRQLMGELMSYVERRETA